MRLFSILNSGESLEKTIVLTELAILSNKEFYSEFDETYVAYSTNLPKKKEVLNIHGTIGGLVEYMGDKIGYNNEQLWEDKEFITEKLRDAKLISARTQMKLLNDKDRFYRLIPNVSWYEVFPEVKDRMISRIEKISNENGINLKMIYLNLKEIDIEIIDSISRKGYYGRLFFLNADGTIGSKVLERGKINEIYEIIRRSVNLSFNVYGFIISNYEIMRTERDVCFGIRYFKRFEYDKNFKTFSGKFSAHKRKSYVKALDSLKEMGASTIIEPSNYKFGELLKEIEEKENFTNLDVKTTVAVYHYLNKVL